MWDENKYLKEVLGMSQEEIDRKQLDDNTTYIAPKNFMVLEAD